MRTIQHVRTCPYYLVTVLIGLLVSQLARAEDDLKPIFDGRTFAGWQTNGGAIFTIEDGVIHARTGDRKMGWLCTSNHYGDFILELDVNIASGNSGVQIRSHFAPDEKGGEHMVGDQIEVDPTSRAWSGGLYDQGRRGWLYSPSNNPVARAAFKTNRWNHYRIECEGDFIKSRVNGVPVTDSLDALDTDGFIALQLHNGTNADVRFRDLRLQDQGRHEWRQLWDGQTFDGWTMGARGVYEVDSRIWAITNGMIRVTAPAGETNRRLLVWDTSLRDFVVRLKYKIVRGEGTVRFRLDDDAKGGLAVDLGMGKPPGRLRDSDGHLLDPSASVLEPGKGYHPDDWNTLTVYWHGNHVAADVNGHRTTDAAYNANSMEGRVGLEIPGGQDAQIDFKDIEILEKSW